MSDELDAEIDSALDLAERADNASALAGALGVARSTVFDWREHYDDCPPDLPGGKYDVMAWRRWMDEHGKGQKADRDKSLDQVKVELGLVRIEKERLALRKQEGMLVDVEAHNAEIRAITTEYVGGLRGLPDSLRLEGVAEDVVRIVEDKIGAIIDSIRAKIMGSAK